MLAVASFAMSSAPAKVDMRELLDGYRQALETAEAVRFANWLSSALPDGTTQFSEAFECIGEIWEKAGFDPEVHEREARRFKDSLVVANRGLVRLVAKSVLGVASKNPENLAEAEQEGAMGVMRAVDAFDPKRGLWSICARHWIRYYVQTCAHRQTDFPRQRHQRMPPEVARQANIIRARLGREPLHSELLSKGVMVTQEQWSAWTERAQFSSFTGRDGNDDDSRTEDLIADEKTSPELVVADADFSARLKVCIDAMSPRNRDIMTALFIDGDSMQEVLERFQIHKQRVHEMRNILADRLKRVLTA